MTTVFIIGGAGKIGRRLAQRLTARGHQAVSLHRDPSQADDLRALGAHPVQASLTELDAAALAQCMAGSDVAVFAAGAGGKGGPEMTQAIDGRGLELAVAAARLASVKRFVLVSAFPESLRGTQVSDTFEVYMSVKKLAEVHLADTDLDWVILRPGTLLDTPGTGTVRTGWALPYGEVSRDDVAATLVEIIEHPALGRAIVELTQGSTPVKDSIERLLHA